MVLYDHSFVVFALCERKNGKRQKVCTALPKAQNANCVSSVINKYRYAEGNHAGCVSQKEKHYATNLPTPVAGELGRAMAVPREFAHVFAVLAGVADRLPV